MRFNKIVKQSLCFCVPFPRWGASPFGRPGRREPSRHAVSAIRLPSRGAHFPERDILKNRGGTMAQKDSVSARERRLRRAAAKRGLSVRKMLSGHDRGRFLLIREPGGAQSSHDRAYPHSFSLEEAEAYCAE
jgi:hypothetical protein